MKWRKQFLNEEIAHYKKHSTRLRYKCCYLFSYDVCYLSLCVYCCLWHKRYSDDTRNIKWVMKMLNLKIKNQNRNITISKLEPLQIFYSEILILQNYVVWPRRQKVKVQLKHVICIAKYEMMHLYNNLFDINRV